MNSLGWFGLPKDFKGQTPESAGHLIKLFPLALSILELSRHPMFVSMHLGSR